MQIYIVDGLVGIGLHGAWATLQAAQTAVAALLGATGNPVTGWERGGALPVCNPALPAGFWVHIHPCQLNNWVSTC